MRLVEIGPGFPLNDAMRNAYTFSPYLDEGELILASKEAREACMKSTNTNSTNKQIDRVS